MVTLLRIYVFVACFFANRFVLLLISGAGFNAGALNLSGQTLSWSVLIAFVVAWYIASKVRR